MGRNLVVFDLEMNQGYKSFTFDYEGVEQTLRGEIIQIGAAKVDEAFHVLDTFQITMCPKIFRKLHHHVAKVTGLTQQMLKEGVPVKDGLKQFLNWCGKDVLLLEWGMDDVPVLKQNLLLLGMDVSFPKQWFDIQQMVSAQFPPQEGEKMNLEAVVERMELPMERPFHDALCDVLYTCEVAQKLDSERAFAQYQNEIDLLYQGLSRKCEIYDFTITGKDADGLLWRYKKHWEGAVCPHCGGKLNPEDYWAKYASNSHFAPAVCEDCGKKAYILFKLSKHDGLHWTFARATRKFDEELLAKWQKEKEAAIARQRKKEQAEEQKRAEENS